MFRSIRWTLQTWHAGILGLSLLCFGAVLYHHERQAMFQRVDAELEGAARVLAHGPIGPPPRWFTEAMNGEQRPSRNAGDENQSQPRPTTGPGFLNGRPPMRDWWAHVPQDALRRLGQDAQNQPYFAVWESDGSLVRSSTPASLPPLVFPRFPASATTRSTGERDRDGGELPSQFRQVGLRREVIVPGPHGIQVLVGASIAAERAALTRFRWNVLAFGLAFWVVGLGGGWILSQRAIRPIDQISVAASGISASDLSRRIAVDDTHSELGSLAATLNATFDRLQQSFERQVRFTADASHELRTPLSVIQSHGELSLSRERSSDEYRQTIQTCLRAARRMRSLVDGLLVLARSDSAKLDLRLERFNIREAAEECLAMVASQASELSVQVESRLMDLSIDADRMRLSQLLINLLTNAIRYNRPGGTVNLSITAERYEVVMTVADTGVGIAVEDQVHVFERFFRADKARSREAGGSGLGLAICQGIVDAHGGTITFSSEFSRGTTFTVRLPLTLAAAFVPTPR